MEKLGKSPRYVGFGEFELDLQTRELWVDGSKLDLQEQPFQVLAAMLEKPGELITREELTRRLWPVDTFVDFEHSLNRVINRLREALDDSAESPRFVETLPRRGYRFVAEIRLGNGRNPHRDRRESLPSTIIDESYRTEARISSDVGEEHRPAVDSAGSASHTEETAHGLNDRILRHRFTFVAVVIVLGGLAGLLTFWVLAPAPTFTVVHSQQLTNFARIDPWGPIVSDGSRIFFLQREGDHWNVAETSVRQGDWQIMPVPFHNTVVLDISPDHTNFLIASFTMRATLMPLWIWPVQGGTPMRVGDLVAYAAKWCPDGRSIIYSKDDGIYQAQLDGLKSHLLIATHGGYASWLAWSPDGKRLRYTVFTAEGMAAIWEVNADGTNLHRYPVDWKETPKECCGSWTSDGAYYFFTSGRERGGDIWAIREKRSFLHPFRSESVRLTLGPIDLLNPVPSPDGHRLLTLATNGRCEVVRFDPSKRQFSPWLPKVSAYTMAVSPDGTSVVYEATADFSLVRLKVDGSESLVLSPPGLRTTQPDWSPDGKRIVFQVLKPDGKWGIFVVSADGGPIEELIPDPHDQIAPAWSPDGKSMAFERWEVAASSNDSSPSIQLVDLVTKQVAVLPGSRGYRLPTWSPDGRSIAAIAEDHHSLAVFDRHSQQWTELATGNLLTGAEWSKDGKDLYIEDLLSKDEPVYRIHLANRKREQVTDFGAFLRSGTQRAGIISMTPNGSLVARLDRGSTDIYTLDLDIH